MSWEQLLQGDPGPNEPLRQRIDALFAQQRATWSTLRDGEAMLAKLQRKTLASDGDTVAVQVNPARRRSTLAKTDATAVAARACFLCPENMPAEERGVAFGDLVALPNPYPILPLHCTIASREHRPQSIDGRIDTFLCLAKAIGPDMAALYNGPRCGASAPDHFHFQAASAQQIEFLDKLTLAATNGSVVPVKSFGRNLLVFAGAQLAEIHADIERSLEALRRIEGASDEPMFNLLATFRDGRFVAVLFPRAAHRPTCYFKTGPDQLSISPAILEMCGILVTTEPDHFSQIDAPTTRAIYEEVSIGSDHFEQLVSAIL
jgi:hypothetical protein